MADVNFTVGAQTKQARDALKKLTDQLDKNSKKIKKSLDGIEKNTSGLSKTLASLGGNILANIATSGFNALSRAVDSAFTELVEFDKALTEISTILPQTTKQNEALAESLSDVASAFATDRATQAKAFYQIVSAGIKDAAAANSVLESANTLSLGGLANLEVTVTALTKVISIFGNEAGTAADISDILFKAVENGQTRVEDLASALPAVLGLSKALGVSFADTAAAVTTLTKRTESTSVAVTQLRAIFSSLLKNQVTGQKVLRDLGFSTKEASDLFSSQALRVKGLAKFLGDLNKASETTLNLQKILGGRIEALTGVLNFASDSFKSLIQDTRDLNSPLNAASNAADKMKTSLDFQFDKAIRNIKDLGQALIIFISPILITVTQAFNKLFSDFERDSSKTEVIKKRITVITSGIKLLEERLIELRKTPLAVGQTLEVEKNLATLRTQLKGVEGEAKALADALGKSIKDGSKEGADGLSEEAKRIKEELARIAATALKAGEKIALSLQSVDASVIFRVDQEKLITELDAGLITLEDFASKRLSANDVQNMAELEQLNAFIKDKRLVEDSAEKLRTDLAKRQATGRLKIKTDNLKKQRAIDKQEQVNLKSSFATIASLTSQNNATLFNIGRASALANAIIEGKLAISRALGAAPPPFNFALAALVGVATAANIADIVSAKPPGLQGGLTEVPAGFPNDSFPARLQTGERVVSAPQNEDLTGFLQNGNNRTNALLSMLIEAVRTSQPTFAVSERASSLVEIINEEQRSGFVLETA